MKQVLGVLTAAVVLALSPAPAVAQSGPAGAWELTMSTPQGNNTVGLTLALNGDKVTGDLSSPMGAVPVTGTATGNDVKVTAEVSIQGMALTFNIDGKVNGDAMDGTVKVGDFGEFPFTGKRAAATPVAASAAAAPAPAASATTAGAGITDLNGKWDIKLAIAGMGEIPATAVIKQEGDKLTGTLSGPAGDLVIAGTVNGRTVKIDFEAETPQGKLPVSMTGDMGATSVTGKASIAGMGEADWTATRAAVQ
ncbi:MAG TPA: hypothetical protein VM032_06645 [Vicinamibacterales bacterium]|nr:hypothetical protein [Vicinamibacterales bacterium]